MAPLSRRPVASALLALLVLAGGCSDDGEPAAEDEPPPTVTTTTLFDLEGLGLEVPDGYTPIPVRGMGFAFAVPQGWQATLLSDDALDRLADAELADPAFADAATAAASVGAVLYAAGVDEATRVTDVKLDVQPADDVAATVAALTDEIARRPELSGVEVSTDAAADPPMTRIRYQIPGPGGDGPATAQGTQYLFAGDGEVWSMIITSEDAATHDEVADTIAGTFVLVR